jgi:hypothetical protein
MFALFKLVYIYANTKRADVEGYVTHALASEANGIHPGFLELCGKAQYNIDQFVDLFSKLFTENAHTNYIHYLGASHLVEIALTVGPLGDFANHATEGLNKTLKQMYLKMTNKGGGKVRSSTMEPMVRKALRKIYWDTGLVLEDAQRMLYSDAEIEGLLRIVLKKEKGIALTEDETEEFIRLALTSTRVEMHAVLAETGEDDNDDDIEEEDDLDMEGGAALRDFRLRQDFEGDPDDAIDEYGEEEEEGGGGGWE